MKNVILCLFMLTSFSSFAQSFASGGWKILNEPRENLMGKHVDKIVKKKDGSFDLNTIASFDQKIDESDIETSSGANEKLEVEEYYRNFYSKYFKSEQKLNIYVKVKGAKILDLNLNGIKKVGFNKKVVTSGLTADSVTVRFSYKRESSTDYAQIAKTLKEILEKSNVALNAAASFILTPDSITSNKKDSIVFDYKISNNKVLYKVKVAKIKLVNKSILNYGKYFWDGDLPTYTLSASKSTTKGITPEWWGNKKNLINDVRLRFDVVTKKLFADYGMHPTEIPMTSSNYWDSQVYLGTEVNGNLSKFVIVQVYGSLKNDELTLNTSHDNDFGTYLYYPEFKIKWY